MKKFLLAAIVAAAGYVAYRAWRTRTAVKIFEGNIQRSEPTGDPARRHDRAVAIVATGYDVGPEGRGQPIPPTLPKLYDPLLQRVLA